LDAGFSGIRFSVAGRLEHWEFAKENAVGMHNSENLDLLAFPGFFSQVNFATNELLLTELAKEAGEGNGREALDLYAGTGNFSLPLLSQGWLVTSVENAAGSLDAISFGAELNGLQKGLAGFQGRVEKVLPVLWEEKACFDLVVLDPPRAGAKGMMPGLARLDPSKIIYISCHPAALARDANELIKLGYQPGSLMVFDHFPHTGHVEALLGFEKS
jgi:23S rRNA (uracil1939-C5)-methyltransferase